MSVIDDASGPRWIPVERPAWVAATNAEGEHLDLRGVVPLDPESLLSVAIRNTGLDDFGDESWREPFHRLATELDEKAALNLIGRLMTRQELLIFLEGRLRVEATYAAHPEIEDEEIVAPLVIVGQARTGTTALQNMLSAHPDNGTVLHWEAMYPCPPPETATYYSDPRIEKAERFLSMWNRVVPDLGTKHEFASAAPTESIYTQCLSFISPTHFCAIFGQAHEYFQYVMTQVDITEAYRYEKRVMKLLQWKNPRKRWIMKSPVILSHLPQVLDVYPDAGFIWTHRDPVKALASVISIVGTLQSMRSDTPFLGNTLAMYASAQGAARTITEPIGWLENGTVPRDRLCNIHYADFVRDQMAAVEHIYEYFGLELTEAGRTAMSDHVRDNPRGARPAHEYEFGSDEEISLEREAFKEYQEYFDVASEI